MKRLPIWTLFFVASAFACTTTTASSGGGDGTGGGACPCTVGNSGIQTTLACGGATCMTLNGTVTGYRCTDHGAVEDMSVCSGTSPDGGAVPEVDAGPCGQVCFAPETCGGGGVPNSCGCTPRVCGSDGGPECGEADD